MKLICIKTTLNFVQGEEVDLINVAIVKGEKRFIIKGENNQLDIVDCNEYKSCFEKGVNIFKENNIHNFSEISEYEYVQLRNNMHGKEDEECTYIGDVPYDFNPNDGCAYLSQPLRKAVNMHEEPIGELEKVDIHEELKALEEENTNVSILDIPLPEFFEKEGLDIKLDYKIKDKYIFENERFKEANNCYSNKQYVLAIDIYKSLVKEHASTVLFYNIGACYIAEGYYAIAIRYLGYAYNMAIMNYEQNIAYNCCYNKINCYIKCQRLQLAKLEISLLKTLCVTKKQKKEAEEYIKNANIVINRIENMISTDEEDMY